MHDNIQSAIDAGKQIAAATQVVKELGGIPWTIDKDGQLNTANELLELQEQRAEKPRRLQGTAKLTELAAFVAHVNRFKDPATVVFAVENKKLVAVYDYHQAIPQGLEAGAVPARDPYARWGQHRAEYTPPLSAEWQAWMKAAGAPFAQVAFADFIEQMTPDIAGPEGDRKVPTPAELYTMATRLKILSNDTCETSIDRNTGEYNVVAKQEHITTGSTVIPREFDIAIPVFEGGAKIRMICKFRLKKSNGEVQFGFVIPQADRHLRRAFDDIRATVERETKLPVWAGQPE